MLAIEHPVEAGQVYEDNQTAGTVTVESLFVSEDGQTEVRIEQETGRQAERLTVDADTFVERVFNGELELIEEAN